MGRPDGHNAESPTNFLLKHTKEPLLPEREIRGEAWALGGRAFDLPAGVRILARGARRRRGVRHLTRARRIMRLR